MIIESLCSLLTLSLVKVEDVKIRLFASAKLHRLLLKQSAKGTGSLSLSSARSPHWASSHSGGAQHMSAASPAPWKGTETGVTPRSSAGPKAARVTPGGLREPSWKKLFEVTYITQGYSWFETEDSLGKETWC